MRHTKSGQKVASRGRSRWLSPALGERRRYGVSSRLARRWDGLRGAFYTVTLFDWIWYHIKLALCLSLALSLSAACKNTSTDSSAEAPKKDVKVPEAPSNGCPMAIQDIRLEEGQDGHQRAYIDAYNVSDQDFNNYRVLMRTKDKDGNVIKDSGGKSVSVISLSIVCKAKQPCELYWPFVPGNAQSVDFAIMSILDWSGDKPKAVWAIPDYDEFSDEWPE